MSTAIDGWYDSGRGLVCWYRATSHAHAAALVEPVLDLLSGNHPWPLLEVRGSGVRVRLSPSCPDSPGLAAAVSAAAQRTGLTPGPEGAGTLSIVVDSPDPDRIGPFWRAALDHEPADGGTRLTDPLSRRPDLIFEAVDGVGTSRNRLHLDAGHPGPVTEVTASALASGGTERRSSAWYATLADADGNEVDLVPGGLLDDDPELADWRALFAGMACYPGTSSEQACRLVRAASHEVDRLGVPLQLDLRPEGAVLDSGKDRWEAAGFAALAAFLQRRARSLGLVADPDRLRFMQVGIDAVDVPAVRGWWRAVLGYQDAADAHITDLVDPHALGPVVFFQEMDDDPTRRGHRNRLRLHLPLPAECADQAARAATANGGAVLDERTLADPEGNELRISALPRARGV